MDWNTKSTLLQLVAKICEYFNQNMFEYSGVVGEVKEITKTAGSLDECLNQLRQLNCHDLFPNHSSH